MVGTVEVTCSESAEHAARRTEATAASSRVGRATSRSSSSSSPSVRRSPRRPCSASARCSRSDRTQLHETFHVRALDGRDRRPHLSSAWRTRRTTSRRGRSSCSTSPSASSTSRSRSSCSGSGPATGRRGCSRRHGRDRRRVFNLTAQTTHRDHPCSSASRRSAHRRAHHRPGSRTSYALLLFPDGRPVPRWRAPALVALYSPLTAAAVVPRAARQGTARPGVLLLFFGLVVPVAGVLAQAYRFRSIGRPVRAAAGATAVLGASPGARRRRVLRRRRKGSARSTSASPAATCPSSRSTIFRIFQPVFLLVPLALFLGLLRYRLWDIDRVVNRTLVYGLATGHPLSASTSSSSSCSSAVSAPSRPENDIAVADLDARRGRGVHPRPAPRSRTSSTGASTATATTPSRRSRRSARRLRDQVDLEAWPSSSGASWPGRCSRATSSLLVRNPTRARWSGSGRTGAATERPVTIPERSQRDGLGADEDPQPSPPRQRSTSRPAELAPAAARRAQPGRLRHRPGRPAPRLLPAVSGPGRARQAPARLARRSRRLRAAGVKLAVPLVSQGELIGVLNLGPRLSEQEYSADDRKLLDNLASQAAPALRVAQLVREQEAEIRTRERYEQELRIAHLIQQNFLPREAPELAGWTPASVLPLGARGRRRLLRLHRARRRPDRHRHR